MSGRTSPVFLHARDVSVFRGGKAILREISLQVRAGEVLAIVGPNGAGKTTLMKAMLGFFPLDEGEILLEGRSISSRSARERARRIAYVPQQAAFPESLTVMAFLRLGRYAHRGRFQAFTDEDRRAVERALTLTGVGHLSERRLDTLSGGEQRTVLIAAALVQEPTALFLDEPAAFLDPAHQVALWCLLERLRRETGLTLVFVTHDLREALRFSERVVALKAGRVMYDGPSASLADEDLLARIFDARFRLLSDTESPARSVLLEYGPAHAEAPPSC